MHILLALDGSEFSQTVCDFVVGSKWMESADYTLLYVQEPLLVGSYLSVLPSALLSEVKEKALAHGNQVVDSIKEQLAEKLNGCQISTKVLEGFPPSR